MDDLAEQHWQRISTTQRPQFDLPHDVEWSVWHRGRRLTTWSEKYALTLIHTMPSQQYWVQKHTINNQGKKIAWEAMYQAYKTTPSRFKLWIPKWLSGWMPIGSKSKQWKVSATDVCPRCGDPEVHCHHVLRCPQDEATYQWAATLTKVRQLASSQPYAVRLTCRYSRRPPRMA
jgi:hypothetical protein